MNIGYIERFDPVPTCSLCDSPLHIKRFCSDDTLTCYRESQRKQTYNAFPESHCVVSGALTQMLVPLHASKASNNGDFIVRRSIGSSASLFLISLHGANRASYGNAIRCCIAVVHSPVVRRKYDSLSDCPRNLCHCHITS